MNMQFIKYDLSFFLSVTKISEAALASHLQQYLLNSYTKYTLVAIP